MLQNVIINGNKLLNINLTSECTQQRHLSISDIKAVIYIPKKSEIVVPLGTLFSQLHITMK